MEEIQVVTAYFFIKKTGGGERVGTDQTNTQSIASVEDMPAVARSIVTMYCEENDLDEKDIYPSIWNDIISELRVKLFHPCNKLLKLGNALYNEYDRAKVYYVYEYIYKRLCNSHCQEITLKGFCDMTGIHKQSIYNWANDNKYIYTGDSVDTNNSSGDCYISSITRFDLHEKIMDDNEESLFALMKDRRYNPMKLLPKLNKVHGWSMPGAGQRQEKRALTDAELPKLGGSNCAKTGNNLITAEPESGA